MIPKLTLPFAGSFPVTCAFGSTFQDSDMSVKLQKWGLTGHNGVDYGVPSGTPVLACDSGTVLQSGVNGDYGISVTIKHRWGSSIYGHLSESCVHVNERAKKSQILGLTGQSGYATGPHLHFGIRPNRPNIQNGYQGYIDPPMYLPKRV